MDSRRQHLRRLLQTHAAKDTTEAQHLAAMLTLLADEEADPFSREHYQPGHFTASAFVLCPQRTSILLILHGKLGRWLQPGGHVEPSDADIEQAARREALEETGLDALELLNDHPLDLDVHAIPAFGPQPGHAHFDVRFAFIASSTRIRASSDARAARWVPIDQVSAVEADASVMRAVGALRHFTR